MTSFLTVDGEELSLRRCLGYLRDAGQLAAFLGEILRQHLLQREIANRGIQVSDTLIDIAVADFCEQHELRDRAMLAEWLVAHDDTEAAMLERIRGEYRLERLKHAVTSPELEQYFLDRRPFLGDDPPASLSDPELRKALREELFERWIGERLERLTVELHD